MKINLYKQVSSVPVSLPLVKKVVQAALPSRYRTGQVNIFFVTAQEIKKLNQLYRHKNSATDVLSFPLISSEKFILPPQEPRELGDIFICPAVAARQVKEFNQTLRTEIIFLLIHGLLHLIGYDHIKISDRQRMEKMQNKILLKIK